MSTPAAIELQGVEKVFEGGVRALAPIWLRVGAGEFVSVVGPSGCGKSTLLRLIAGLEKPSAGTVRFDGDRRRVSFVFQDAHLLPWRNVLGNVVLPLELMGRGRREAIDATRGALDQVGLSDAVDRFPNQLSGGMRMRVSLARALVADPELLLMDEPFAALDEITRQKLDDQLRELWARRRMTVLFVTHSIIEAAFLAERTVVMSRRPGRIVVDRKLELPEERTPGLRADAGFAREMRTLYEALESGRVGMKWVRASWPPLIPLIVVMLIAELVVRRGWVPAYLVPAPSKVIATLHSADLWLATRDTAIAALTGFALSAAGGLLIAIALASACRVQRAFYPYAVFFQTVPIIAIAPLLVIWIGYGMPTVIASAFIVSVFPVIANALSGLLSTDPALRDLFRLYGASPGATLFKLRLPFAMPQIMTGLRIAGGLAVIGAIVGEFITGGGLGGIMDISRTQQRIDKVFAGLLLAAMLGIVLFALVNLVSAVALRHWHASEKVE